MEVIREPRMVRLVKWISKLFIFFFILTILLTAVVIIGLLYLRSQPLPTHHLQETTTIYAADGQIIDTIHQGQNRTYVPIEQMPSYLLQAAIAVEDQRFFEHYGIDFKRVVGAMIVNVKNQAFVEGASTITQQLARNLYLNHDKTWQRKLQEAIYTIQLEMHYSKSHILERYLNQIYFGHSAYGVESAAQLFFGKSVSELTLAESAMLAGIPKGPRYYSPFLNMDNAKTRQELILRLMQQQGFISEEERSAAVNEELVFIDPEQKKLTNDNLAPFFTDYVRSIVIQHYGIDEEVFEQGGLRIYTTLDPAMQKKAEDTMAEYLPLDRELQGALVAMDPRTGSVRALVGGKNYQDSPYNRAFAERQPGSSIKPFLYYAALEQGFTPLTLMKSEPTVFTYDDGRATYTPRNFNDSYPNDYITMERAIAKSDNIYAVKTIQYVGEELFIDTLQRFGLDRSFAPLPSLALGAQNVNLFQMVRGYSALANEGALPKPLAILRIEDRLGNTIVHVQPEQDQALDSDYVFILNRMMRSVFEPGGTGHRVSSLLNRPVAGKTGSTDTDAWMIGYTPQLVTGVWVGYDQGRLINHNNDGRLAAQIWATFLEGALEDQMPALFPVPEGVVGAYINPDNGKLATEHCPAKKLLYFKQGTEPTEFCLEHLPEPNHEPEALEVPEPSSIWDKFKDWWHR
ncbi:transglycosylase domain-containing protein [Caldalkalibacillus mannanilyticus]|uniref:transglycosylase domain-containing protein n=1 Tax=Caldalkalibacillus mannanilyticus TaxID=1418 RepID=UPI0004684C36|nr:PBP1A family penicillin-binding protein [Caldalkalibacillus mannanilyticus]